MADAPRDLFAQQESNRRQSSWLLIGFILFFAWVGFGGDIVLYLATGDAPVGVYHHVVPFIGIAATLAASGFAWTSWAYGDKQVLWSTRAMELVNPVTEGQQRLVNVASEMAIASGQPMPTLYLVPDDDANAFATGRDPQHASLAVTDGLLTLLDRDELQGVVAHEMGHIARYDTQLMTLVAAMVGSIALMSDGFGRSFRHGGSAGGGGIRSLGRRSSKSGGFALVVLVLWLVTLVLAPLISRILAMAISRKREFLADATAAQFTRNPAALARALEKLATAGAPTRAVGRGTAHLCIVDPGDDRVSRLSGAVGDLLSSHPPIAERVARLRAMGFAS